MIQFLGKEEGSQHKKIVLEVKKKNMPFRNRRQISLPSFHSNPEVLKFIRTNEVMFWLYDNGKAWHS